MLRSRASWTVKGVAVGCVALAFLSSAGGAGRTIPATALHVQEVVATLNDPFLALGSAAVIANLWRGLRDLKLLFVGLAGTLPLLRILVEGGPANPAFELAIPFCLNVAFAVTPVLDRVPSAVGAGLTASVVAIFMVQCAVTGALQALYLERPAAAEREALAWVRSHVPPRSTIAVDPWALAELEDATGDGIVFTGLRLRDPRGPAASASEYTITRGSAQARQGLTSPAVALVARGSGGGAPSDAGALVKRWVADGTHVELRKANGPGLTEDTVLAGSAHYLGRRFERAGAYMAIDGTVTAQSQANAMLRAVWSDDRQAFMRAWRWTATNLANAEGLLASSWANGAVVSAETAAEADVNTALALLMGSRRWTDEELLLAGRRMVDAIWRREVVLVNGAPYMAAGDWAREPAVLALATAGFAPYAYETFALVDPQHDWAGLVDSGYRVLTAGSAASSVGLPPDWMGLDRATGSLTTLPLAGRDTLRYGNDAARTYWRVALHHLWYRDARADRFLRSATFLHDEVARRGISARSYSPDGRILDPYPSGPGTAAALAALAALLTLDPVAAESMYASQLVGTASRLGAGVYWGDLNDLTGQEWGWFATALYANRLPDLWRSGSVRAAAEAAP
jgi:endo-1,4-beta-D-glucanase Y